MLPQLRCAVLTLFIIVASFPAFAANETTQREIAALLDLSGLTKIIENIPKNMAAGIANEDFLDLSDLSADDIETLKDVLVTAFDAEAIKRDVLTQYLKHYDAARTAAVLTQLRKPLSRRITQLEKKADSPEETSAYEQFVARLALHTPDPARVALIEKLDKAAHGTEIATLIQIQIIKSLVRGITTYDPNRDRLSKRDIDRFMEPIKRKITASIHNHIVVWSLFAYRSLSNPELKDYIDTYKDENIQWFMRLTSGALLDAMHKAARRADSRIIGLRNAQEI